MTPAPPTFLGTLSVETDRRGRPWLYVSFRCPACRRVHHHTWDVDPADGFVGPHHRAPHCDRPAVADGYLVGPDRTPANERVLAEYAARLAAWEARQAERATNNR